MTSFHISAAFDVDDPDSFIECTVKSGGLDFEGTKAALVRFRDHLTERIDNEHECPLSPKHAEGDKWWGYIHQNGTIQVKRYFGPNDLQDADESPFVKRVFQPFIADGREAAIKTVKGLMFAPFVTGEGE